MTTLGMASPSNKKMTIEFYLSIVILQKPSSSMSKPSPSSGLHRLDPSQALSIYG